MDNTENVSSTVACSLIAGETCSQSWSLGTAVVLSPVYAAANLVTGLHVTITSKMTILLPVLPASYDFVHVLRLEYQGPPTSAHSAVAGRKSALKKCRAPDLHRAQ
jgi:hypothetical protein